MLQPDVVTGRGCACRLSRFTNGAIRILRLALLCASQLFVTLDAWLSVRVESDTLIMSRSVVVVGYFFDSLYRPSVEAICPHALQ